MPHPERRETPDPETDKIAEIARAIANNIAGIPWPRRYIEGNLRVWLGGSPWPN